ncbi:MAG: sulfate adenylyltransferase [Comamonadaceae bacterium]|uniref:sulfate adenylyltransferase subunit 1 n=1 Tax=Candidatus Skiveiella danica TaxID=3386177 RepID=UPI00390BEA57|nr:sulfate adenylyltransferase [Comamonadaceae bacterium]
MSTTTLIATNDHSTLGSGQKDTKTALRFITCGSVDDGKSTLIGRLLVDSKSVLQDQLAGVQRQGETDLALLTDGLSAEREQGITIDVAYRYFNTEDRKFIIGDAPGHEQYTRNMVTAASSADAAVVLVDATKLDWSNPALELLVQTRRHSLLCKLLRVPSIVFAVNKLDAVADAALAFAHISRALETFATAADIAVTAIVPVSALKGWNVVDAAVQPGWCGYTGPTLLALLETLPATPAESDLPLAFPVQWVEKFSSSADTSMGRRVFWGRVATGTVEPGTPVQVFPSGQTATVAQVLDHARRPRDIAAGHSAGIVLDREVDVSRGDWIVAAPVAVPTTLDDEFDTPTPTTCWPASRELSATIAWMDDEPLIAGRVYWALQGHRWVKAKVRRIVHRLDVNTLQEHDATQLEPNAIGHVELLLQEPLPVAPFARSRVLGSLILVDTATHKTSGAALLN